MRESGRWQEARDGGQVALCIKGQITKEYYAMLLN